MIHEIGTFQKKNKTSKISIVITYNFYVEKVTRPLYHINYVNEIISKLI